MLETPDGKSVAAELLTVTPLARVARPEDPGFSLVFRAATAERLPQGIYPLAQDRLGRLDVFLVPIGRDADGLLLEAVFN
jgi:hypothetical protein